MATEIERKYLIVNDNWRDNADESTHIIQGYLGGNDKSSIRIRVHGNLANLNIKSKTLGMQRSEYEYQIPIDEAKEILESLCDKPYIEKTRYHVPYEGHVWEVDIFAGENKGLIVAELELDSPDEPFKLPNWVGMEVTEDHRYYNICLISHPYKDW